MACSSSVILWSVGYTTCLIVGLIVMLNSIPTYLLTQRHTQFSVHSNYVIYKLICIRICYSIVKEGKNKIQNALCICINEVTLDS